MYRCPIDYYNNNLVFNADKSCWAAFKLVGYDYDYLSLDTKIMVLNKLVRLFVGILSEAQILIVPIEQDTKRHFKNLRDRLDKDDVLYDEAISQLKKTEAYLAESKKDSGTRNDYRTYLLIKLEVGTEYETINKLSEYWQYFIKNPMNAINVQMNLDTKDILKSKVIALKKMADEWLENNKYKLNMEAIDTEETQWLFRRMPYRGTDRAVTLFYENDRKKALEPKFEEKDVEAETIIRPYGKDIINLFTGTIYRDKDKRCLRVETDTTTSYQAFFAITGIPEVTEYPGYEWLHMLQKYNMQTEVCIHIKAIEYRAGLKKLDAKKKEINSQIEHVAESGYDVSEDLIIAKEYADLMEHEIKNSRSPMLATTVSICVADSDKEKMEQKCARIKETYEDMNFIIERPKADQTQLYMQYIPSVGNTIKDYVMLLTPRTLAAAVIGATHELGDSRGPYIGTTGHENKHVFLDLALACLLNKSPAATFFGNLGVGKSFNANLLLYLCVLYGGYGLIFDPKGERSHWIKALKPLKGLITIVTLSSDVKDRGKLDPYNIYKYDLSQANELAINILSELFKISPTSDDYIALLEAARRIGEGDTPPSMLKLASILESFDKKDNLYQKAYNLARKIRLQQTNGMAQLLFGNGTEEAISFDNRLNIIQIQNLKMPSPEAKKEDYTTEENLSVVLMMVLSQFAKQFALVKRPVFKCILFDESWMLGKTREGEKLYEFLSRMGRSLFTGVIYNGHSVLDIPTEGIRNTITYKFCFQTTNNKEATRMLEYLDMEDTEENREIIKSLGNRECLFQDLNCHVGKLKFDAVFQDIIDAFSTTPEEGKEGKKENPEPKPKAEPEEQPDIINIDIYEREVI